jgi:flagellar biogenesis protein FliO
MNVFTIALLIAAVAFILLLAFSLVRVSGNADAREEKRGDNEDS